MYFKLNRDKNKKVHFIGIGGVSMSGLAAVLLRNGYKVSGSDSKESEVLDKLRNLGAEIYIEHKKSNIKNVDLIVYTAAIQDDNPEILLAKQQNIQLMDRAEFLGCLMKDYKYNIAIAGTHGKTTTTSMVSHMALSAELDPTILVGGNVDAIDGNFRIGNSDYFITEACEYKASFLKFPPYIGVLLNIDADHLDFYRDIEHIEETFKKFSELIPLDGYLVGCAEDKRVLNVLEYAKCNKLSYGINSGDIQARNIVFNHKACAKFEVYKKEEYLFDVELNTTGRHNVLNALATIAIGLILNIPYDKIQMGLLECRGAHKRFEYKGEYNGAIIIDDYAHHPVEISATLSTAKLIGANKIYCVFQPHTYTRTKTLFNEFVKCFELADELILMDIYAAREKDTGEVSSDMLCEAIRQTGFNCINLHDHAEVEKHLASNVKSGDLIITIGAGDVVKVGEMLLERER